MIEVIQAGLLTTVQDFGRPGHAHLGISAGGAADRDSFEIGNRLVGNHQGEAALEMTLKGGTFRFLASAIFAVTGAELSPTLDGTSVPSWRACHARAGQVLTCGGSNDGARSYLAVSGGIDVPLLLGSRSTLLSASLGGLEGRPLRGGDRLAVGRAAAVTPSASEYRITRGQPREIRITPGAAWTSLSAAAQRSLLADQFNVSEQSNRSGIRLSGPELRLEPWRELLSEGVTWGTVQLPASGQPIVLMNEQQTTGGYPKIAHVVLCDLPTLGQLRPRDHVRFTLVDISSAAKLWKAHRERVERAVTPC